jgi:hypothetical protein
MKTIIGLAIVLASLAVPSTASAQSERWKPWLGCWSLTTENVREGRGASTADALTSPDLTSADVPEETVPRTCVMPSGDGVTITTTVPGQAPITQTVVADGSGHDLTDGQCRGVEHTEWSASGRRLYAKAEMTCGNEAARTLTGIALISPRGEWIDIRSFRIDGRDATRVSRYHRVAGVAVRMPPLSLDEIKEASTKVAPAALEAAVAQTKPRFDMNKQMLLDLSNAKVPPNVIDVMVAASYPDRFVIEEPSQPGPVAYVPPYAAVSPFGIDPFDPFYSGYYYYPGYYYSPFGYGYLGRYDPFLFGGYPIGGGIIGGGGGGTNRPPASGVGRAINGQGYTRIHPADAAAAQPRVVNRSGGNPDISGASAGSSNVSSSAPRSDSGGGNSSSGSSGGGGGSASPQGYSGGGGGGGGDTGRTAVPR